MSGRERKGAGRLSRPCELFVLLGLPLEKGEKAAFLLMNERRKKKEENIWFGLFGGDHVVV